MKTPIVLLLLTFLSAGLMLNQAGAQTGTTIPPDQFDSTIETTAEYLNFVKDVDLFVQLYSDRVAHCSKSKSLQLNYNEKNFGSVYLKLLVAESDRTGSKKCKQLYPTFEKIHNPAVGCIFSKSTMQNSTQGIINSPFFNYYIKNKYPAIKNPDQVHSFFEDLLTKEKSDENKK